MADIIKDGTGSGKTAKIDACNRLHTHAFTVPFATTATAEGDAFNLSTELVTLTTQN